ncbi:mitochondrial protein Pet127-domain-containing protein [Circinella umbellata]|nr:mitochondrial protein Pet127-domain-containing protein [Circinella umbellata]
MLAHSRSKVKIHDYCRIALLRPRSSYYVTATPNRLNLVEEQLKQEDQVQDQVQEQPEQENQTTTLSFKNFIARKKKELEQKDSSSESKSSLPPFINDQENVVIISKSEVRKERKPILPISVGGKWQKIDPKIKYQKIKSPDQPEVAKLAHGLDRVLFNPGVHYLRDPRTQRLNFPTALEYITQPHDFDYNTLTPYTTSSRDTNLLDMAREHDTRYIGSTSSVSGVLSQLYFLISQSRPVDTSIFSDKFGPMGNKFTRGTKAPASINLMWRDGVYAVDAYKSNDVQDTILSILGKSMEKVLTLEPNEYERYLKNAESPISEAERNQPETYAYGKIGHFLLRSQLDCQDPRLPRKTFDLKTRAAVPIRLDMNNYKDYLGYSLRRSHGLYESFEREYFDMLRSAFLKYSFQVRIGHMDGIFVAYHNTRKIFGFQYISREEMDVRLFGSSHMANESFRNVLVMFESILDKATEKYPNKVYLPFSFYPITFKRDLHILNILVVLLL